MFVTSGTLCLLLTVQAASASMSGVVRDAVSGEPLAGAVVALTDLERTSLTDDRGRYVFAGVPAGPQHVLVRRIGYGPRTLHALVPSQGAVEIHVTLRAEPITMAATEARTAIPVGGLEHDGGGTFPDRRLSIGAVRHHPLLAEPDAFQALGGGEVVLRPEAPGGVHVRGGAADQVGYALDGIPVLSPFHAAGSVSAWNPDALSELRLATTAAASAFRDVLSGVISGTTRTPGATVHSQGSVSTTQARVTIDGPLPGATGAGFLVSTRSGFPGVPAPKRETSYLTGESGDWLVKVEAPLLGGRIRGLSYGSENEITAATVLGPAVAADSAPNEFGWSSRSLGGDWSGRLGRASVTVRLWRAESDAGAVWRVDSAAGRLHADRRDEGFLVAAELPGQRGTTTLGVRSEWSRTAYRVAADTASSPPTGLSARTPVSAAFLRHTRHLGRRADVAVGLTGAIAAGAAYWSPGVEVRWRPAATVAITGDYQRRHQFAQSLRNGESVVGMIFPVDLYVGAGASGIPVARSDQGVVAAEYRPAPGIRLGAQAYIRGFQGLVLVAPRTGDPFATNGFAVGGGHARGASVEVGVSGTRYGITAAYGLQLVRLSYGDTTYAPEHGATHTIDAGVIVFPTATLAVRLGAAGVAGRRATALSSPLEWEACNLLDGGCEFAGSPRHRTDALGATALPAYARLDLGIRKHWHMRIAGRDRMVALFGTITNLLGRRNLLTVAPDPATGAPAGVEMRPRAPLVVGLDWRF